MELTRTEIDAMLRRADEARTKLRRATRELQRFGEQAMATRDANRTASTRDEELSERLPDADRSG
jgi:hypothetical protein